MQSCKVYWGGSSSPCPFLPDYGTNLVNACMNVCGCSGSLKIYGILLLIWIQGTSCCCMFPEKVFWGLIG